VHNDDADADTLRGWADRHSVSTGFYRALVRRGALPHTRDPLRLGCIRIARPDVARYLTAHSTGGTMNGTERLLKFSEAGAQTGMSARYWRRLAARGEIDVVRFGSTTVRLPESAVSAYVAAHRQPALDAAEGARANT
jgi:excisionase family DNA binding protein